MFIDVVNAGWVPIYNTNLSQDVPGYMAAPAIALSYPWTHFISGHLGRLATREDVAVHQQYIADIEASAQEALATVNPVPYFMRYGENAWAGVKGYLDEVAERTAAPVIAKYTGVLNLDPVCTRVAIVLGRPAHSAAADWQFAGLPCALPAVECGHACLERDVDDPPER
jgi:hypothetical protein